MWSEWLYINELVVNNIELQESFILFVLQGKTDNAYIVSDSNLVIETAFYPDTMKFKTWLSSQKLKTGH